MNRLHACAMSLVIVCLAACAREEPEEASGTDQGGISYGDSAAANLAVVELFRGNGGSYCTGFFISSRHIVTAAHCTDSAEASQWYRVRVKTGYGTFAHIRDASRNDDWMLVTETTFPSWSVSSPTANSDMAILTLPTGASVPETQAKQLVTTVPPHEGQSLAIWGWGRRRVEDKTPSNDLLSGYDGSEITVSSVDSNESAQRFTAVVNNEARTCDGDSGGPATRYTNGNYVAVGAHRGATNPGCAWDGATMYWSSLADKTKWIEGIVRASGLSCTRGSDTMKCF
jgi:V8-like Glu-specific endopeptidase